MVDGSDADKKTKGFIVKRKTAFSSLINSAAKWPRSRVTNPIAVTASFISFPTPTLGEREMSDETVTLIGSIVVNVVILTTVTPFYNNSRKPKL